MRSWRGVGALALAHGLLSLSSSQEVHAFQASTGRTLWCQDISPASANGRSPLLGSGIVSRGGASQFLAAFTATNGHRRWEQTTGSQSAPPTPAKGSDGALIWCTWGAAGPVTLAALLPGS